MSKRVFVSADWKDSSNSRSCDAKVVDRIRKWRDDKRYIADLICADEVHNTVLTHPDCRRCDIKGECGSHIDWSSVVIIVIGDNTAIKSAGLCDSISCSPSYSGKEKKACKYMIRKSPADNLENGRKMSYLEYEIKQAAAKKSIILVFNSMRKEESWIPSWYNKLSVNELCRVPFWKDKEHTKDCYLDIKEHLQ